MTPLPFAPPPKDSSIYQQLESTTLNTLTPEQLDTIRAKTFSQGTDGNEDEYRRLLLLGLAADQLSVSGPMPGTGTIEQVTQTSDVGLFTIFKPESGVYQFNGGDLLASGGTGAVNFYLYDGSVQTFIGSASVNGQEPLPTDTYGLRTPFFVTEEMYFVGDITTIATSIRVTAAFIRVRG